MNKRAQDLRLGLWRIEVLHEASRRAVWGGMLGRILRARGHRVPLSILHDAISLMVEKGWLSYVGGRIANGATPLRLTDAGAARLARLRAEISALNAMLQGGSESEAVGHVEQLVAILDRNTREIEVMRSALRQARDIVDGFLAPASGVAEA